MRARRAFAALLAALLTSLPALAQACASCGVANGRNKTAFFVTTVFLSLLPLAFIGGVIVWLVRNARGWVAGEFRESDEPADAPAPESGPAR